MKQKVILKKINKTNKPLARVPVVKREMSPTGMKRGIALQFCSH